MDGCGILGKNRNAKRINNPFEKDVDKIASSFFVINFPESLDAKGLWKKFQPFGRIVDAFIANKRSKNWNEGFDKVKIHYFGGLWVWIQFANAKSCESFKSNESLKKVWIAIRTVSPSFIVDERMVGETKTSFYMNDVYVSGNVSDDTCSKPPGFETCVKEEEFHEDEADMKGLDDFDGSVPPGFEKLGTACKGDSPSYIPRSSKCSTSFGNLKLKGKKCLSFINEMNKMIEVGGAPGYDVTGCKRSFKKMINGIGASLGIQETKATKLDIFHLKSLWGISSLIVRVVRLEEDPEPDKALLWGSIRNFIQHHAGYIILFRDLNEVRYEGERYGTSFSNNDALIFNSFIHDVGLIDLPLGEVWNSFSTEVHEYEMSFPDKLRGLKSQLKAWYSCTKESEYNLKKNILMSLRSLDAKIDAGCASDEDRQARVNKLLELEEIDKLESMDLMQKARLKWDVEGDENSKFVHGIINSKRKSQMINGILNKGVWITDPNDIKTAFLNFYKEKFSCLDSSVSFPPVVANKRLGDLDRSYLDSMVSLEEIKDAVWDCGSQKAPGPDGFSFHFIKKYWDLVCHDIQKFVIDFSSLGFHSCKWESYFGIFFEAWSKARDPLSPFLFIMVMEGLNIMLKDGLAANLFCGVKIGSPCFHLSHLFYADDVIIFSKRNQCDMDNIIRILDVFYLASSLKININKSNLYGVGVSSEDVT
nr:hypothetical protein [Tanacetum cinerariifolium]